MSKRQRCAYASCPLIKTCLQDSQQIDYCKKIELIRELQSHVVKKPKVNYFSLPSTTQH
ncbi:MAG TPA: hypothetical protein PKB05_04605 [Oligoflexia bacterium]|nr:hypothetical protein [Oligoflexia bacterium]